MNTSHDYKPGCYLVDYSSLKGCCTFVDIHTRTGTFLLFKTFESGLQ